jgi:hypothetical protein
LKIDYLKIHMDKEKKSKGNEEEWWKLIGV